MLKRWLLSTSGWPMIKQYPSSGRMWIVAYRRGFYLFIYAVLDSKSIDRTISFRARWFASTSASRLFIFFFLSCQPAIYIVSPGRITFVIIFLYIYGRKFKLSFGMTQTNKTLPTLILEISFVTSSSADFCFALSPSSTDFLEFSMNLCDEWWTKS
jgi:hypothetical protein